MGGKNLPRPKKGAAGQVKRKSHIDGFFDIDDVHNEFSHQGQTVNCWYYLKVLKLYNRPEVAAVPGDVSPTPQKKKKVLKCLRENVRRKRPQLWRNNSWFLHHANAPAHASLLIRDFLANTNRPVLPQPPYSPDLALVDFSLFAKLKSTLKG
jgi:hypothetical protein